MEISPLGVKVLTVVTGVVQTNIARNGAGFTLPQESYYKSLAAYVGARARLKDSAASGMEAEVYAESVVRAVLAEMDGTIWRGAFTIVLRIFHVLLPRFLLVSSYAI